VSLLGAIAFITGVLGVWLTIKQNILCWPLALVSVVSSAVEFQRERLYGDMALQVFYFFAGVYGWIYWHRNLGKPFAVSAVPRRWWLPLFGATAVLATLCYYLLLMFNGDRPFLDGLLTACSLVATYMMTRKWVENWLAWVIIDGAYVLLYLLKDMWIFAVLYLFFAAMALYGFIGWRKKLFLK
jgi:nicotinamide mononucleotide transporter